ncbi:hypothetical protein DRQ20_01840 [bacterium]|nr:MAG: hypothetical protein DRQ20_01840 [bacterium]
MIVLFSLFLSSPLIHERDGYTVIEVKEGYLYGKPGAPLLPEIPLLVKGNPEFKILMAETINLSLPVYPAQRSVPLSHPEKFTFTPPDEKYYSLRVYPGKWVEFKGYGWMRGERVKKFILHPVIYLPCEKKLIVIREYEIEGGEPVKFLLPGEGAFDCVIITDSLLVPYFTSLVEWHKRKGILTEVRTLQWIEGRYTGRDRQEKIRNYLKTLPDSGVVYAILGGDVSIIPEREAFAMPSDAGYYPDEDSIPCDLYYADLDGTWDEDGDNVFGEIEDSCDLVPDVVVGRAPVTFPQDVEIFINKVITYERAVRQDYQENVLFLGNALDAETYSGFAKDMILPYIPYSVRRLYALYYSYDASWVVDSINIGMNIINHNGHGGTGAIQTGTNSLYYSVLDTLKNKERITGIFYSIGCWTCAFDYTSFGEAFVLADSGGGFYIGNSRYGWYIPGFPGYGVSDVFDRKFFELLYGEEKSLGEIFNELKLYFVPRAGEENDYRWMEYTLTLLADPTMYVYTRIPESLRVTVEVEPAGIYVFAGVENARVSVLWHDSLLARGNTDATGSIFLSLAPPDTFELCVFAFNHIPFIDTLFYTPSISLDSLILQDEDGDGIPEPGETIGFEVCLTNNLSDTVKSITISSNPPLQADTTLSLLIPPGDRDTICFSGIIGSTASDGDVCVLIMKFVSQDTTRRTLTFEVKNWNIVLKNYSFEKILPGGSGNVYPVFTNTGGVTSPSCVLHLSSPDTLAVFPETLCISSLSPGDSLVVSFLFQDLSGEKRMVEIYAGKDTMYIPVGYSSYHWDCSDLTGWTCGDYWDTTSYRYFLSGYAFYCGIDSLHTYPSGFTSSLITPPLEVLPGAYLEFWTWYHTEGGWDFCMVEYEKGGWNFLDVLAGPSQGWEHYRYKIPLSPGDTTRIRFTFYSEEDEIQFEGWYLDEITFGSECMMEGIEKKGKKGRGIITTGILYLPLERGEKYAIFDITGRKREKGVYKGRMDVRCLPAGVYFIRTGEGNFRILKLE